MSSGRGASLRGFTVIELVVASSIIVIITTVLLFRHGQFNSSILLRALSYSVALSIRQAQLYGTSVRETASGSATFPSYGVYFKSGDATHYFLGADSNPINNTIATDGSEDVTPPSPYKIGSGFQIKSFCATVASTGADHCYTNDGISNDTITTLTIRFLRPNPDALIVTDAGAVYSQAYVQLESPGEDTRGITVTSTGQISVGLSGT
ncbi:hypothetical protein A2943_02235 [Candidatus Adlerbacteria bacterium RIFCSPLOWO2_01_FULL_51_16]|uniref:General secretion pathway GspH domain-containing protein n=1 Tax=Candidatus Adlerbacteria bacterium RIFCSPLOWO2_01_FULL_51_16 TaxID=1797243 RepID=A0A1F4XGD8_9BACT|nr:MAG: hypothetical protein A2943_02235 [Candidatus Adlerbacteria bacterium RIFCSPLOWO2_01_FULL_51_16]